MFRTLKNWWRGGLEQPNRSARWQFRPRLEAFEERRLPSTFVVTDPVDSYQAATGTDNPKDLNGLVSLRSANAAADVDSVHGKADTITFSTKIEDFQFLILGPIDLAGGSGIVTINAGKGYTVSSGFELNASAFTTEKDSHTLIKNMTFTDCNAEYGGAIFNAGDLALGNCTFYDDTASESGGAIYNVGKIGLANCSFSDNGAAYFGGAICNFGSLTINGGAFSSNTAEDGDGGAIASFDPLSCTKTTFEYNSASINGGAIASEGGSAALTLSACTFDSNAAEYGGAICLYMNDAFANPKASSYSGNTALMGDNLFIAM